MKRQIRTQYFIIWFKEGEGEGEDYAVISAKNITEAKDRAEDMFGEDVESVQFYNP